MYCMAMNMFVFIKLIYLYTKYFGRLTYRPHSSLLTNVTNKSPLL